MPSDTILNNVRSVLNAEDIRPLTDRVTVQAPDILFYNVVAELILFSGPDSGVVRQTAQQALEIYVSDRHRLGQDITLSGIYAALHQPGVQNVVLETPTENLVVAPNQAPWAQSLSVSVGGRDE